MIGTFIIWVEDQWGHVVRAFTWHGSARDGIAKARVEALLRGMPARDIWATPVANKNAEV